MSSLVVLLVILVLIVFIALSLFPDDMYLKEIVDYDTVIMQHGIFSVVHNEKENCIYFVGINNGNNIFAPKEKKIFMFAKFNLVTGAVEDECYQINNTGKWDNEFAENARELYAYMTYFQVEHGTPKYNIYMGISEVQPGDVLLGPGTSELQYAEIDGLYVFMFLEEFSL